MPTFEIRCDTCRELRWPMLSARPTRYVCARCTAVSPAKRAARVAGGGQGAEVSPNAVWRRHTAYARRLAARITRARGSAA